MLNGFRILLLIVLLLGIVLIVAVSGYTYLMFGDEINSVSSTISVAPPIQKSRTFLEVQYSPIGTKLPYHDDALTSKSSSNGMLFWTKI